MRGPPRLSSTTPARAEAMLRAEDRWPGGPRIWHHIPGPRSIGPLDPHLFLTGAALALSGIDSVWISVDDGPPQQARVGLPNALVKETFPEEHGPGSGNWMIAIDKGALGAGTHEIRALAVSAAGSSTVATRVIEVDLHASYQRWLRHGRPARVLPSGHVPSGGLAVLLSSSSAESATTSPSREALRSLLAQTREGWRAALVGPVAGRLARGPEWDAVDGERRLGEGSFPDLNAALTAVSSGDASHIVFLHPSCRLQRDALELLTRDGAPELVYCDSDRLAADGTRTSPFFRPDWSPELLLALDYIGPLFVLATARAEQACALGGTPPSCLYDLLLRLLDEELHVLHVPSILYTEVESTQRPLELERRAVHDLAARRGLALELEDGRIEGTRRLRWKLRSKPLVSVVIPTAGSEEMLGACMRSLAQGTSYENIEIVLVDTTAGTREIDTTPAGDRPVRVLPCAQPFNYSIANNLGTLVSRGEVLLYLNDDTEAIVHDWIERMLEQLGQPGVGVVGAKLLYPEGLIQHAGVFFATPGPLHAGVYLHADAPGYMGMLTVQRNCAAVTGACLMTSRTTFDAIGGFDEQLVLEYGDLDFCLAARRMGLRVVMPADTPLLHMESVTRGSFPQPRDQERFRLRWPGEMLGNEPFFPRDPMRP